MSPDPVSSFLSPLYLVSLADTCLLETFSSLSFWDPLRFPPTSLAITSQSLLPATLPPIQSVIQKQHLGIWEPVRNADPRTHPVPDLLIRISGVGPR